MLGENTLFFILSVEVVKKNFKTIAKSKWHYKRCPKPISYAFTLAEVLVTLVLVGVVSSMTIPNLISDIEEAKLNTQWKETFSIVNQAMGRLKIDNGGTLRGVYYPHCEQNKDPVEAKMKYFASFYNYKNIVVAANYDCGNLSPTMLKLYDAPIGQAIKLPDGSFDTFTNMTGNAIVLNNGAYLFYAVNYIPNAISCDHDAHQSLGGGCADFDENLGIPWGSYLYVDTNGKKGPNMWGKDFFIIRIAVNGVYAHGVNESTMKLKPCNADGVNYMNCGAWRLLHPDFKMPY